MKFFSVLGSIQKKLQYAGTDFKISKTRNGKNLQ
jgi:hypothetical protein